MKVVKVPPFLDIWLSNSGEVFRLARRPRSTPQKHLFSISGSYLRFRLSKPQGRARLERLNLEHVTSLYVSISGLTNYVSACSKISSNEFRKKSSVKECF
jgi:hypothetical protein